MERVPSWRRDAAPDQEVVERELGATRILGKAHRTPGTFAELAAITRELDATLRGAGVRTGGPILTVLRSNPHEVAPSRRHWFTAVPVLGPVTPPPSLSIESLHGGLFILAACRGRLSTIDDAFGYLFARFFPSRGQELARPEEPEIRLLYPTVPHDVTSEADLVIQVAVPVVITMRTDTMRNQR